MIRPGDVALGFLLGFGIGGCCVKQLVPVRAAALAPQIPYARARLSATRIIREKCARCHGGENPPNGLDLSSRDSIAKGGKRGPALIPYKPYDSLIWQAVTGNGDLSIMPPFARLEEEEIEALRIWIYHGAQTMTMGGQEP
jgi:mono/diheme cytochrome c family protein